MHVVLVIVGLKTVIGELPPASSSLAANICRRITGRLTNAISKVTISRNACSILLEMDINSKITLVLYTCVQYIKKTEQRLYVVFLVHLSYE